MKINIEVVSSYKQTFVSNKMEIPEGSSVVECLNYVKATVPDVCLPELESLRTFNVAEINGTIYTFDTILKDGDNLFVFPLLTGG